MLNKYPKNVIRSSKSVFLQLRVALPVFVRCAVFVIFKNSGDIFRGVL